jgi:hypothetical protein
MLSEWTTLKRWKYNMLVVTFQAGFNILDGADIKGVVFKAF